MRENSFIHASGGIVWKKENDNYKIAVIYRERYGKEWSLPKGKLLTSISESWKQAALRETEEELGLKTKILSYADTITYYHGNNPKVIVFWHMIIADETKMERDKEVKEVLWLTLEEAIEKIKYEDIKAMLSKVKPPKINDDEISLNISLPKRFYYFLKKITGGYSRYSRLRGELHSFKDEMDYHIEQSREKSWTKYAKELYRKSICHLEKSQIDEGWKTFHAAKRMMIFGMNEKQLKDEAHIIRIESEKLNNWRRQAVYELIGHPQKVKDKIEESELYKAAEIRDEHFNNQYYKNRITRNTYKVLLMFLILVLSYLLIKVNDYLILPLVFFGMLGAVTSSVFKIRDSSRLTRIPEVVNNNYFTITRLFIGAVSAFVIYLFLKSGIDIGFSQDTNSYSPFTFFVIAFASGFSERLLRRAVSTLVDE